MLLTLTAERLKLDEIFALAQLDGLSGEGTMHGTLPITIAGAEAVIEHGELVSDGPGWVRYRPTQPPAALEAGGQNVNLLLQALENFRYKDAPAHHRRPHRRRDGRRAAHRGRQSRPL